MFAMIAITYSVPVAGSDAVTLTRPGPEKPGQDCHDAVVAKKFGFRIPDGVPAHRFPAWYAFGELAINVDPRYVRGTRNSPCAPSVRTSST
ncbi:hypothetical protein ACWDU8_05345 [Streptomyces sp. NPDC003388]|uniref:hypothetical protein n=1 Tax=Streptomyces sp. ATE26 TaxID=2954237 RepID=UPI0024821FBB|nr:hypothetical protein [Streptomyces sp. ATE26]MDI1453138.1 hypothetical protein [Streptomyces sp. ATE26]